jgi:uncharacterized protein
MTYIQQNIASSFEFVQQLVRARRGMLQRAIVTTVVCCTRYAVQIIGIAVLLGLACGIYAADHFAIDTDVNKLISQSLAWRQREAAFNNFFSRKEETILAVIDAPTSELATQATAAVIQKLSDQKDHFHSILEARGGPFFQKNGLLFLPTEEVVTITKKLGEAKPLIQTLAQDSNLRGLTTALNYGLIGARMNQYTLDDLSGTLNKVSDMLDEAITGRPASFSWRAMLNGRPPTPDERRRFVEIRPVLDYAALMPGKVATDAIRQAAIDLDIGANYDAKLRLTGPVAIADEEYATLEEAAFVNTTVTIVVVLTILWLALRSWQIILAVFVSLIVGLSITAAIGLAMVGALNLISVAFAVLFIGLGVDFGIQFSVRYRAERHEVDNLHQALVNTASHVGAPLTLAAAATAAGFLSFLPTDYKGLSELGLLAGLGMIIAFLTSITLIPALLTVLRPPGEPKEMGFKKLASADRFMERHRIPVIIGTGLVVAAGLPLLYWLQFDFNPLNLRSAKVESVATFLELRSDPAIGASSIYVLAPKKEAAKADELTKLPEVSSVKTIESFIPDDQQPKLAAIRQLGTVLDPVLRPDTNKKPPTDADNVAALKAAVDGLKQSAGTQTGRGATVAKRLADDLAKLAGGDEAMRARAHAAMIPSLNTALDELRNYLQAQPVTLETLPPEIAREWVTQDGRYKVEILPKGDPTDNETLRQFALAVQQVEPNATGGPIAILESGRTVVRAFYEAGFWALGSIIILLWIVLRRFGDVLLTIIPLLMAGVVTMELMVLFGMKLNFANIIALPLLLGVGVAFKIYYIMAWRAGQTDLLQSSLTRAVMFSALTTATAFGSLWLSSHPGTSSMGKLMALALVTTMAAAVLFQPVLMGPPRERKKA